MSKRLIHILASTALVGLLAACSGASAPTTGIDDDLQDQTSQVDGADPMDGESADLYPDQLPLDGANPDGAEPDIAEDGSSDSEEDAYEDAGADSQEDLHTDLADDADIVPPVDSDGDGVPEEEDCNDEDPDNWDSCEDCRDVDEDGWFVACDAYTEIAGPDCNDQNDNVWEACDNCKDVDDDGFHSGCDAYATLDGPDCNDDDPDNWLSCDTCADGDEDGYFSLCDAYGTISGPDCDDENSNVWESCDNCADEDEDGIWAGCDAHDDPGPDCDDEDENVWTLCESCADADEDGVWAGCDAYTSITGPDCDDTNPNAWTACESCIDVDQDTYFDTCDAYITVAGPDCDDGNDNVWSACEACTDADEDLQFAGCDAYASVLGPDCDDSDPDNWLSCTTCADVDEDGYFVDCDAYGVLDGPDCNDEDKNNWTQCETCVDLDQDSFFVLCDAYVTIDGPDCHDVDENNWDACETCLDEDEDGAWAGCNAYITLDGPDCNDADENNWDSCDNCLDEDQDDWFANCDAYITVPGPDCNDLDHNSWITCGQCADGDGDGVWGGCDGYVDIAGPDCNDQDKDNWDSCDTCLDEDQDNWFAQCDAYEAIDGPDCDDDDKDNWLSCLQCMDADADGFWAGCDAFEDIPGPDCDDQEKLANPSLDETPYDGIDNDCEPETIDDDFDFDGKKLANDCDDDDPDNWDSCALCDDADADDYFAGCDAYVEREGPDCNDLDENAWTSCASCMDFDGDQWFAGCDAYATVEGPDCNDLDQDNWTSCDTCKDGDKDDWFAGCDAYTVRLGPDCNDEKNIVSPGLVESFDSNNCQDQLDNDCDDLVDAAEYDCPTSCEAVQVNNGPLNADGDGDGFSEAAGDCDDTTPGASPIGSEVYDGIDNDCNGTVDDGFDDDCDGFVTESEGGDDCDDDNYFANPGRPDDDPDWDDENCDGLPGDAQSGDSDGDGLAAMGTEGSIVDCDDNDPYAFVGAAPLDDENACMRDRDNDDFGDDQVNAPIAAGTDCQDTNPWTRPGAPEFPDDGVDNDCAGDGDLTPTNDNGVFAATLGNDGNPGTMALPKRTISAAVTTAVQQGKMVFAAAGNYSETTLDAKTHIFGGYEAVDWTRDLTSYQTWVLGDGPHALKIGGSGPTVIEGLWVKNVAESGSLSRGAWSVSDDVLIAHSSITGGSVGTCPGIVLGEGKLTLLDVFVEGGQCPYPRGITANNSTLVVANSVVFGGDSQQSCIGLDLTTGMVANTEVTLVNSAAVGGFACLETLAVKANRVGFQGKDLYFKSVHSVLDAGTASGSATALWVITSHATLVNSILYADAPGASTFGLSSTSVWGSDVNLVNTDFWGPAGFNCLIKGGGCVKNLVDVDACQWQGCTTASNSAELDPDFIDPGVFDYHLGLGTQCVDQGQDPATFVGGGLATVDVDGELRPAGTAFDLGLDEAGL